MKTNLKAVMGAKVRAAREFRSLSQEQLAELIGRTPETVSNIERGKTAPALETAQSICVSLGLKLSDLFVEEDVGREPRRVAREFELLQILRQLSESDFEIAETTIEAIYRKRK